ncbi:MAG: hypothetical protein MRJ96_14810 [Nitrospirales bacterium]|nr:hypothetical protein [Nitrospirales bacterium]
MSGVQELERGIPQFVLEAIRRWQYEKRTDQLILNFHQGTIGSIQFFKMKVTKTEELGKCF